MKKILVFSVAAMSLLFRGMAADYPVVYDGWDHGDPPFMLEDGWTPLLNGTNLDGWSFVKSSDSRPRGGSNWMTTTAVAWGGTNNPHILIGRPGHPGGVIVNTAYTNMAAPNLLSDAKMSDFELWVEFMIPKVSNSGVFVAGIYEMQVWDSFGIVPRLDTDRTGALYHYAAGLINGIEGGTVPLVRAERDHGYWNSYHIWYRAPRFDASGKKIQNAMVLRALCNGQLIHEYKERLGRTVATPEITESPTNNYVVGLQGDHGYVAFRNIYYRPLRWPIPGIPDVPPSAVGAPGAKP
jgi:hypothetical protein